MDNIDTPDEALALITDLNLTVNQYENLRMQAILRKVHIYPSYCQVLAAKKRCYAEKVEITETEAKVFQIFLY